MKKLAKTISRGILRVIINDLPISQREFGQAMLAELEETDGLQALVWASGGIQLWAQTRGGEIMKNAAFWFGLVTIGILAGGLYVTKGLIWAVPVAAVGVIAFASFRPRDAVPVALLLGLSLPIADLVRVWIAVRGLVTEFDNATPELTAVNVQGFANSIEISKANDMVLTGAVRLLFNDPAPNATVTIPDLSSFLTTPTNYLPQLTVAVLLSAIVIAGISAFIRTRVMSRNVISQN